MNVAVCIRQTPDTEAAIQIAPDERTVLDGGMHWIISPHDETAVEQALRLVEENGGLVTVYSLGPPRVDKALREALAMGADRGVRLDCDDMPVDPAVVAYALAHVLGEYDLILTGEQAIDHANAQVPQRIAAILGRACVTAVEELSIDGKDCTARRVVEGGEEIVRCTLPAVIGTNRRLMEPRYPSFRNIMRAKKKPIDVQTTELGESALEILRLRYANDRVAGRRLPFDDTVPDRLAQLLRDEAKVI